MIPEMQNDLCMNSRILSVAAISIAILSLLVPPLCIADASGEIVVSEIRVQDKAGKGVKSNIFEVTRKREELLIDVTDEDGVFSKTFTCPQWHKVVAKPVAGPYTDSPHTSCAPKLVLTVWNIDAYPEASVRIIVPFAAGGTTDFVARNLVQRLEDAWKQKVVIENKAGGGGNLGTATVAGATPDGYTLLMGVSQNFTIYPNLYSNLPYDPRVDLSPVSMLVTIPNLLVAPTSSPTNSVKDVIDMAKANPGKLNFASMGVGSESHLLAALLGALTGTTIRHIQFASSASAVTALLGGQVNFAFNALPLVLPSIKAGKIKALAVAGPKRAAALPEVPTMAEAGIVGYDTSRWIGLFAPAGTPEQLVRKIQSTIASSLKEHKLADLLVNQGMGPVGSTSDHFAAVISKDATKWEAVIKVAGFIK